MNVFITLSMFHIALHVSLRDWWLSFGVLLIDLFVYSVSYVMWMNVLLDLLHSPSHWNCLLHSLVDCWLNCLSSNPSFLCVYVCVYAPYEGYYVSMFHAPYEGYCVLCPIRGVLRFCVNPIRGACVFYAMYLHTRRIFMFKATLRVALRLCLKRLYVSYYVLRSRRLYVSYYVLWHREFTCRITYDVKANLWVA